MTQDILLHLRTMDENLRDWELYLRETPRRHFVADRKARHALLHCALVSLQSAIDVGNHWVSRLCPQRPESYRLIAAALEERKAISPALAKSLKGLFSLRNVMIHDYPNLDLEQLYRHLKNGVAPLRKFLKLAKAKL
ncbi:MAG: DUF86 domain-containing protein [candidate division NC10 bacterium]